MEKIYQTIHKIAGFLKVICAIFASFYIFVWILKFANTPHTDILEVPLAPFAAFVRFFCDAKVDFSGRWVDVVYLVCAAALACMYPVFALVENICSSLIKRLKLNEIKEREREEARVNKRLQKEYRDEMLSYTRFLVLLELNLNTMIEEHMMLKPVNLEKLKSDNYLQLKQIAGPKHAAECQITNSGIYFLFDDFSLFDKFLPDFLSDVNEINYKNRELEVDTSFYLTVDALRKNEDKQAALDAIKKISSFGYTNKAVATRAFAGRYNFEKSNGCFDLYTMGISRFYDRTSETDQEHTLASASEHSKGRSPYDGEPDENGAPKHTDFELFSLKRRPKSGL